MIIFGKPAAICPVLSSCSRDFANCSVFLGICYSVIFVFVNMHISMRKKLLIGSCIYAVKCMNIVYCMLDYWNKTLICRKHDMTMFQFSMND